jgi:hypothetical protein
VDRETARKLYQAFLRFNEDPEATRTDFPITVDVSRHPHRCRRQLLFWSRSLIRRSRLNSDLKAMLGADGKALKGTGNEINLDDMTGEGPMG